MELLDKIQSNENFYIKDNYLYSKKTNNKLIEIKKIEDFYTGTFINYYTTGIRIEDKSYGKLEYRFYDNNGNLLDKIKEENPAKYNENYMYVLKNGILSISTDFNEFPYYKWTKYNGISKINYNLSKMQEIINTDEQNKEQCLWIY